MPLVNIGLRVCSHTRPRHPASLPICVPSVEPLPPALSRRPLAGTTWRFGYGWRHQPPSGTFHPDRTGPCRAHERRHVAGLYAGVDPHDRVPTGVVSLTINGLSRLQAGAPQRGFGEDFTIPASRTATMNTEPERCRWRAEFIPQKRGFANRLPWISKGGPETRNGIGSRRIGKAREPWWIMDASAE